MYCKYCRAENKIENIHCSHCGRLLNDTASEHYSRKDNNDANIGFSRPGTAYISPAVVKIEDELVNSEQNVEQGSNDTSFAAWFRYLTRHWKLIGRLISGIVILAIIVNISITPREHPFAFVTSDAIQVLSDNPAFKTYIYNTKGDILHTIDRTTKVYRYSADSSVAVLKDNVGSTMYYVDKDEIVTIPGSRTNFVKLSDNGRYLYFEYIDSEDTVYLKCYDAMSKTEKILAEGKKDANSTVSFEYPINTPDGKTYAYTKVVYPKAAVNDTNITSTNIQFDAFLSVDGAEPESFGKGELIFAISDDGENIYHVKLLEDSGVEYYIRHNGKDMLIQGQMQNILFNMDYSEMLYSSQNSTYLIANGKDTYQLCDTRVISMLTPRQAVMGMMGIITYPVETLKNKVFRFSDQSIRVIDKGYQTRTIAEHVKEGAAVISKDGNNLIYCDIENSIKMITDIAGVCGTSTYVDGAVNFDAPGDLSYIYYTDETGDLYYKERNGRPEKIASGVSDLILNQNENVLFFITRTQEDMNYGSLHYCTKDGIVKPVTNIDKAVSLEAWNHGVIVRNLVNEMYDIYFNVNGTDFKLLAEKVGINDNSFAMQPY